MLFVQLKAANEQIAKQSAHIADITAQLKEALARLESIEKSFMDKDESLNKEKRKNKGLTKIIRNEGEQQKPEKPELTDLSTFSFIFRFSLFSFRFFVVPLRPLSRDGSMISNLLTHY